MAKKAKKKDIRDLDSREVTQQLHEGEEKLFRLRFQKSMGQTDSVKRIRELKKERARLLTVQRQREIVGAKA